MLAHALQHRLEHYQKSHLLRERYTIEERDGNTTIVNGQQLVNFCSSDYLGIATHPKVKTAFISGVQQYGLGSGSAALIAGFYKPQHQLEEKFAEFLNRDRALFFNSGYHANLGVITTLADRQSVIIADKLCHASILDGIQLSRAKHYRFLHNDLNHAATFINKAKENCLLITESVFSMEGDISPVPQLAKLARENKATLLVDDAHGIGVLGKNGGGICEYYRLTQQDVPCLVTPFGKAIGSMGAIVSGSSQLIEAILQFARTYRYSTALPPSVAFATLESLKIIQEETWRREKLNYLIEYFIQQAKVRSLSLITEAITPIKSILIGDTRLALKIKEALIQHGFFVSCIRPPSVAEGTTRIRISLNCAHEEHEISRLLDLIVMLLH
ncbi:MAG: 8-amino-7-oxononanoate synthase [Gammaproteobacteria bacterium]